MKAHYVPNNELEALLDPEAGAWGKLAPETLKLMGTPVGLQPTAAIRTAWLGKQIGVIDRVAVTAIHDGAVLAFRLEWADAHENGELIDNDSFPDGAAIALPAAKDAPLALMGAPGLPVNAWYWRADEPQGARQIAAEGLGTSRPLSGGRVRASGSWKGGRWRVVIARSLAVAGEAGAAQLSPGTRTGFGVAIWEGSNGERAGIKAFSENWLPLELDSLPGGRS